MRAATVRSRQKSFLLTSSSTSPSGVIWEPLGVSNRLAEQHTCQNSSCSSEVVITDGIEIRAWSILRRLQIFGEDQSA